MKFQVCQICMESPAHEFVHNFNNQVLIKTLLRVTLCVSGLKDLISNFHLDVDTRDSVAKKQTTRYQQRRNITGFITPLEHSCQSFLLEFHYQC